MNLTEASEICKVLSDPHRLRIMRRLVDGEQCAGELLKEFTISQPTMSLPFYPCIVYYGACSCGSSRPSSTVWPSWLRRSCPSASMPGISGRSSRELR